MPDMKVEDIMIETARKCGCAELSHYECIQMAEDCNKYSMHCVQRSVSRADRGEEEVRRTCLQG